MAKQSEFYHTFKRLRPSDGTAWDTEKERVLEQAWWQAMVRADEMLEAAEFESLVAAKLALGCESQTPCNGCWKAHWKHCNLRRGYWDCADCFLKTARLIVEEAMDEQSQD
jgi:hypothetical protein